MDFLLKLPSDFRAHRHSDFITPPLDGSLTIPELYDFHYENNPNHPVFLFADGSGVTRIPYCEVVPAAHNAARFVAKTVGIDLQSTERPRSTVAILAATDTITYFTTVLGMLRAEIPIFVISPRNSAAAVAHLLSTTHTTHVLISTEAPIQQLAKAAMSQLDRDAPKVCLMPTFEDIYISGSSLVSIPAARSKDYSATRAIVHSSGSTSFPKPIIWNDRSYLQVAMVPLFGKHDLAGEIFSCHAVTMFHGIGLNFIAWVASTGMTMATFPPVSPAVTPTPESVWKGALDTSPSFLFGPPVFFEGWSRDPSKLPFFKQLKGIVYGGAPLQKGVGDYLAKEGVAVYTFYGSTEVGPYCAIFPEHPGLDWEYFSLNVHCATEFVPLGDGTYELVVLAKPTTELTTINSTFQGQPAYATSDFLVPHPTKEGRWKVLGRMDDQIMLNTGEKTNPGPLEAILCQHPHISSAVMFGRGKFQNGVLIEVTKDHYFDPQDVDKLNAFRDLIWPQVEAMNAAAPTHSRLFKEMIIVANSTKPFTYNPKGAPRRAVVLSAYDDEIEEAYANAEKGATLKPPAEWTEESSVDFVRTVVNGILRNAATDQEDIFDKGCDSLQAMWVKQNILSALDSIDTAGAPPNFVYEHPTIASLAKFILSLVNHGDGCNSGTTQAPDIEAFMAPYISTFPVHHASRDAAKATRPTNAVWRFVSSLSRYIPFKHTSPRDVVLITGTSGALGSAVLAKLIASDSVEKIYALNRPSTHGVEMLQRQGEALASRGYDASLASSNKVILVEGDLTNDGLQVSAELREEIRTSITHIYHIAWRVDFNLSLTSFAKAVGGVRGLVDLALSSPKATPPRLLFTSSVGVFRNNLNEERPIPEIPIEDSSVVLGQGYPESKWVGERILHEAAKNTPLRPIVVRVGQISGGINGSWNTSDWVPAIVKSSLEIGFLPEIQGTCSWVPLDFAADALVEMCSADIPTGTAHLVHPKPVPCRAVFEVIGDALNLPLRPYAEWVKTLEDLATGSTTNSSDYFSRSLPAAKTLEFYKAGLSRESSTRDAMGIPNLDISEVLAASKIFREQSSSKRLVPEEIRLWLKYWKSVGFLP